MTHFNIEIISDTICPWCYVGKKKLDKAIATYQSSHPEDTFSTTWKPFYIRPDAPLKGVDTLPNLRKNYGEFRANMMTERIRRMGDEVGIDFKCTGKMGNTRDSHRLIRLGKLKSPETQTRVVEELFASYWEGTGDITSHETLLQAGVKAGLDEVEVKGWLASDKGGKEIDEEVAVTQVNGVPHFKVGKYSVGGAQDPGAFLKLFDKIKATEEGRPEGWSWSSCLPQ